MQDTGVLGWCLKGVGGGGGVCDRDDRGQEETQQTVRQEAQERAPRRMGVSSAQNMPKGHIRTRKHPLD